MDETIHMNRRFQLASDPFKTLLNDFDKDVDVCVAARAEVSVVGGRRRGERATSSKRALLWAAPDFSDAPRLVDDSSNPSFAPSTCHPRKAF